jgi:hypothetical protein
LKLDTANKNKNKTHNQKQCLQKRDLQVLVEVLAVLAVLVQVLVQSLLPPPPHVSLQRPELLLLLFLSNPMSE